MEAISGKLTPVISLNAKLDTPSIITANIKTGVFFAKYQSNWEEENVNSPSYIKNKPINVSYFANDIGYLTQHQDLSAYAKKSDIPIVECFATKNYVDNKVDNIDLSGKQDKLTEQQLNNINLDHTLFLTQHQDISGKQNVIADLTEIRRGASLGATALQEHQSLTDYATKNWVENKHYLTTHQDISSKADKTEIPTKVSQLTNDSGYVNDVSNLATKQELEQAGKVKDVKVNNVSVLDNGVANIPASTNDTFCVVKVKSGNNQGLMFSGNYLVVQGVSDSEIINRSSVKRSFQPNKLDYMVKCALCDNKGEAYTDTEKQNAITRLGVDTYVQNYINSLNADGTEY